MTDKTPTLVECQHGRQNALRMGDQKLQPKVSLTTLPVELIKMVVETCHGLDAPITPIMIVCKALYDVILNTPKIWSRILISMDSMPPSLRHGSTIACQTSALVKRCIQRSKKAPIEVTLVIGQITASSPDPYTRANQYKLLTQESPRITFLCIIINPGTSVDDVIQSFAEIFTERFDSLESLMIASAVPLSGLLPAFYGLFKMVDKSASKLGSLYFENLQTDFIMSAREYSFWRRLKRVTLKGEYQPLPVYVFDACDRLNFLSFSGELLVTSSNARFLPSSLGVPVDAGQADGTPYNTITRSGGKGLPLALPHLQWLRLGAVTMAALANLQINRVRFLVIQTSLRDYMTTPPSPHSVVLPELEVLHISTIHSDPVCIVAPKLQTLVLQVQALKRNDASATINTIFDGHELMWKPINLSVSAAVHDKHLAKLLQKLPMVESLTLILQDAPKKTLLSSLRRTRILPSLKSLSIDLHSIGDNALVREKLAPKIHEIAESRLKRGRELEWFSWRVGEKEMVESRHNLCHQCQAAQESAPESSGAHSKDLATH